MNDLQLARLREYQSEAKALKSMADLCDSAIPGAEAYDELKRQAAMYRRRRARLLEKVKILQGELS